MGDADGLYLEDTRNSVVAVQHRYGIQEDGIFGPKTAGVMQRPYLTAGGRQFLRCGPVPKQ